MVNFLTAVTMIVLVGMLCAALVGSGYGIYRTVVLVVRKPATLWYVGGATIWIVWLLASIMDLFGG